MHNLDHGLDELKKTTPSLGNTATTNKEMREKHHLPPATTSNALREIR